MELAIMQSGNNLFSARTARLGILTLLAGSLLAAQVGRAAEPPIQDDTSTTDSAKGPKTREPAPRPPSRTITYKTVGDTKLSLHAFEPEGRKESDSRPAIVFFFGGGWAGGDPKQFYEHCRELSDLGMVAFSAEYRVRSRNKTTPLECVKDAKSAVRWIREHAPELGIDPNRIVASGGSAGGHIAACTSVIVGHEEDGENLEISSKPNAMILFNPVLDTSLETGLAGNRFGPELHEALSPCHNVHDKIAPMIIFHGTADETVPLEQVERFTSQMKDANNQCVLIPFADKGHGFFNATSFRARNDGKDYATTMKHSIEFLKQHEILK
ncbi:MAG: hypothetical protein Aurels2KO_04840 [Aureliella sp.]